ncbi:MAG: ABC transporter permease [Burkholderiaceae bacterium]|nr:ABC transporter permease [Burkholderiaceae bacterium]
MEPDPSDVADAPARAARRKAAGFSWLGFHTLFRKELLRFYKVGFQTIGAPVLTSLLYLLIFSHVLEERVEVYRDVRYTAFLLPGLVMMSVLQNSFANSSSSLIQSKITGNVVFVLLTPLSHREMYAAYVLAAMVRGLVVGSGVFLVTAWFTRLSFHSPAWILSFAVLGSAILGTMGLIAGIWAEKFDQIAAFQNFIVMPATFLSGVFYSVKSLPPFWQTLSHLNPFFYMVDGFRYGFFGVSDIAPGISFVVVAAMLAAASAVALRLLASGYRLRL